MSTGTRVIATAALGVVLGVWFWLNRHEPNAYALVHSTPVRALFLAGLVIAPLLVGRWWIVAALAGPLAFLVY